jgi:hypothetical protein
MEMFYFNYNTCISKHKRRVRKDNGGVVRIGWMEALYELCPVMGNRLRISGRNDGPKGTAISVVYTLRR